MTNVPFTVDVNEMLQTFIKVNQYLSTLQDKKITLDEPTTLQASLDYSSKLWEEHFGIKVHAIWGERGMTFTFKNKETFILFLLEWS